MINPLGMVKVILKLVSCYYNLLNSIITNKSFLFILKYYFSLYYFLGIKKKLPLFNFRLIIKLKGKIV